MGKILLILLLVAPAWAAASTPADLSASLIVAGTPAEMRVEEWPRSNDGKLCAHFLVHAIGLPVRSVYLTTVGLGSSDLGYENLKRSACDATTSAGRKALLWLPLVDLRGVSIELRVPRDAFPAQGATVDGKIRFASKASVPYDIPVRLATETGGPFWTAVLWFFGIAVPALLTALLAYVGSVLIERFKSHALEGATFDNYTTKNVHQLGDFFKYWYREFIDKPPADGWRDELLRKLHDEQILDNLPRHSGRRVIANIRTGSRQEVSAELSHSFPLWKSEMQDRKGERERKP